MDLDVVRGDEFALYNRFMKKGTARIELVPGTHLFLVLWKTYRAMLAKADESKKQIHLGDSDFRVLEALLHKGPLPVNVIGQKVELTTGSITTAIDRLEEKWLVLRKNDSQDRRVRVVDLTPKGRRLIEKGYAQHRDHMEEAVSCLSQEQRRTLVELLKCLGKSNTEPAQARFGDDSESAVSGSLDSEVVTPLPRQGRARKVDKIGVEGPQSKPRRVARGR